QADGNERAVDGEDAQDRAADEGAPGALQGRSSGAQPGDDGALQEGEDQSGRRLPADSRADAVLLRVLLGADRERRDAAGAVHAVDRRPELARSVLRAAAADGRRDVPADAPEPGTAGSSAGARDADHADRVHRVLRAVSVGPRALLADEHAGVDRAAVAQIGRASCRAGISVSDFAVAINEKGD